MTSIDVEHPLSSGVRARNAEENARAEAERRRDGEALMRRAMAEAAEDAGQGGPVAYRCAFCAWEGASADEQLRHAATHPEAAAAVTRRLAGRVRDAHTADQAAAAEEERRAVRDQQRAERAEAKRRAAVPVYEERLCADPACGMTFEVRVTNSAKRYCSTTCARRANHAAKSARWAAHRERYRQTRAALDQAQAGV